MWRGESGVEVFSQAAAIPAATGMQRVSIRRAARRRRIIASFGDKADTLAVRILPR